MDDARCFVVRFGRRLLLHEVYVLLHSIICVSAHNNECFVYFSIAAFCLQLGSHRDRVVCQLAFLFATCFVVVGCAERFRVSERAVLGRRSDLYASSTAIVNQTSDSNSFVFTHQRRAFFDTFPMRC